MSELKVNWVVLWSLQFQGLCSTALSYKLPLIMSDPVCEDTKQMSWIMHLLVFFSSKPVWTACNRSFNWETCLTLITPHLSSVHSPRPANGAAANQITRCTVWCPTAPSRSAWTLCMSRSSAAPSVKMVNTHLLQNRTHPPQKSLSFHQTKDGRFICSAAIWWPRLWTIRK